MPNTKYSDFIEISPNFESVVDIDSDSRNKSLWRDYIVGDDMEALVEKLCQSLNREDVDSRRSFWVEGNYGTGKTYAAITVKHIMEEPSEVVDKYMAENGRLAKYRNRVMRFRAKEKGEFLVVWRTGCTDVYDGVSLLSTLENSIRDALKAKFGDKADYADTSLVSSIISMVENPMHNWDYIIEETALGNDYADREDLLARLRAGDVDAIRRTAAVIREQKWGMVDSLEVFKQWITDIIAANNLQKTGIFFIWDEFTEYVSRSEEHTILQQLSEFSKIQPLYLMLVVHRTSEMVERMTPEKYQLIVHRFHELKFHISTDAAYDLIEGSIIRRNGMEEHWKEASRGVIKNIHRYLTDMVGLDDKISEKIDTLCPMHPMTIKLLSRVAENYAAAQRTMFRFMKDRSDETVGFVGYINRYGPDDQYCWLTPDWLWDYFFTRESDFSDKDSKAATYIRHYEEKRHLVKDDEEAIKIFKVAMLLLALMSTTKGVYTGARSRDGVDATVECLTTCLAGVISGQRVREMLENMKESRVLALEDAGHGNTRIQLPFKGSTDEFDVRYAANDRKYTRYVMFQKDGVFSQAFEKRATDPNDPLNRRMKIAVCCAETNSINNRLGEVTKELEKSPYKLGLLIVTVKDDTQGSAIQNTLQEKVRSAGDPRLTIALCRQAFTDEMRKKWLTALTKQELAFESGQTASSNQYREEAERVIAGWVGEAIGGGRMVAYNGENVYANQYGMKNLRDTLQKNVLTYNFPYAPELVTKTSTAFKACNEGAAAAGVTHTSNNSQIRNVLDALKKFGVLEAKTIEEVAAHKDDSDKGAVAVAALAQLIKDEMESGHKVSLSELWDTLQKPPFGYYSTITCGVLLGFVLSFYKKGRYTWTDKAQVSHVLEEKALIKLVQDLCAGKMETDYISAGSVLWGNFSGYLAKIFNLSDADIATETAGYQSVRVAVTKAGAPFWALKYIPESSYSSVDMRKAAGEIIDKIQIFIDQKEGVQDAMSAVVDLFNGRGKIRVALTNAFNDKNVMAKALTSFVFGASPELAEVTSRLSISPLELHDKLCIEMKQDIYSWTPEEVVSKLPGIVEEYKYLEAICTVQDKHYHSVEEAKRELKNIFKYLRIPMVAIEQLNEPWYGALVALHDIAFGDPLHIAEDKRKSAIAALEQSGSYARGCLENGKPVLEKILEKRNIHCSPAELDAVYKGLQHLDSNSTLAQFDNELKRQVDSISYVRNKNALKECWKTISGKETIRDWCAEYNAPLMWVAPKELTRAFATVLEVQNDSFVSDSAVVSALRTLRSADTSFLTDSAAIDRAFMSLINPEQLQIASEERAEIMFEAKAKIGNDMSRWDASDLAALQSLLKKHERERAKKEKLAGTKSAISSMNESSLRLKINEFLDEHPEFCDFFAGK